MARPDDTIARLAGGAHGVVTRRELVDAGVTVDEIRHRLRAGSLIREYRGVYRAGHRAPNADASYLAAVRACGSAAVLSGLAAAWQYGAVKGQAPAPEVDAPVRHSIRGLVCHRGAQDRHDRTVWRGIPTVTVARALVEIAGRLGPGDLARACHEAGVCHRTTPRQVEDALSRWPTAPGASKLRAVMAGDAKVSLSRLESRFLELLRAHRLALPECNRVAGGRRVDCRWPEARLTVELDSFAFHNTRRAWERDHRREREAYARGDAFRRYTWDDVFEAPKAILTELRGLLPGSTVSSGWATTPPR